jgi:hypothetical protein
MIVSQAVHNSIEYQKANSKANPDANGAVSSVLHPEIETVHRLYRPFQHTRRIGCASGRIGSFAGHESAYRAYLSFSEGYCFLKRTGAV